MNATGTTTEATESVNGMEGRPTGQGSNRWRNASFMRTYRDPESLRIELAHLKTELDSVVSRAAAMDEAELSAAYDQIMAQFSSMRHAARGLASHATRQIRDGVDVTSDYVKDKPMQSVGVATGVGLLVGLLLARR